MTAADDQINDKGHADPDPKQEEEDGERSNENSASNSEMNRQIQDAQFDEAHILNNYLRNLHWKGISNSSDTTKKG